ncbi:MULTISPECIES: hypothetical protein [Crocosphaera]|nr:MULTISPECIES: hypothetical protein [Crocosphaera]
MLYFSKNGMLPFSLEEILDKNFLPNDQRTVLLENEVSNSETTKDD